jgi:DNA polymerase III alpha subunit
MQANSFGDITRSITEFVDIILTNPEFDITKLHIDDQTEIERFNLANESCGTEYSNLQPIPNYTITEQEFDKVYQTMWFMPDEYKIMDIEGFLVNECPEENYQRLIDEINAFKERNMMDLLRWLKYFVDTCRANNIVWGLGRGSSVASYVLYLIGVHKIDPVKYNLDWQEFLR